MSKEVALSETAAAVTLKTASSPITALGKEKSKLCSVSKLKRSPNHLRPTLTRLSRSSS